MNPTRWTKIARDMLIGRRIVNAWYMDKEECQAHGWDHCGSGSLALLLDNGTIFYPVSDPEGNSPGSLFVIPEEGELRIIPDMIYAT